MTGQELAQKCQDVMKYKTCYAKGTFGQSATESFIKAKAGQYPVWYTNARKNMLYALPDDTRLFDCVGLIKGVIWGFPNIIYTSNGFKDYNDQMLWDACTDKSQSFSQIQIGEVLWMKGHVGVYIGDGKAIECTPSWKNGVQITAVSNIAYKAGYNSRRWTGHGKIPTINYVNASNSNEKVKPDVSKLPILRKGSKGEYVKTLQRLLVQNGYDPKGIDGIFGPGCDAAVRKYQKDHGLVVDGYVGPKTWGELYK